MTTGRECVQCFERGIKSRAGNYYTDGKILCLFGNKIAEHRQDGIYFTMAGYRTCTTAKCLNFMAGVAVSSRKGRTIAWNPIHGKIQIDVNEWYKTGSYVLGEKN